MKQFNKFLYIIVNNIMTTIANGLCSDGDDSSKSVYSDVIDPYYLPKEAEFFKVVNNNFRNYYNMGFFTTTVLL